MKILNSAMRAVQSVTTKVTAEVKAAAKELTPQVDSFHDGVRVRVGGAEAHVTANAYGASVRFGEDTFGASYRGRDGAATLGAVAVKAGKKEVSTGIVPAAPVPLPMPVYAGPVRDE
jgi:hypothetical protein